MADPVFASVGRRLALLSAAVVIATIAYMSRLVTLSRSQAREYANLSRGILSSLIRTPDERDHRAARHCAAVARFSRDIAGLARQFHGALLNAGRPDPGLWSRLLAAAATIFKSTINIREPA